MTFNEDKSSEGVCCLQGLFSQTLLSGVAALFEADINMMIAVSFGSKHRFSSDQ
jgi:hypothetical protein